VDGNCELSSIEFDFNENTVRLDMEEAIQANAQCLLLKGTPHRVIGHCDDRGSDEYNLALGQRRAATVARQYIALGVPENILTTLSYGEEQPVCTDPDLDCRHRNRRVDTVSR